MGLEYFIHVELSEKDKEGIRQLIDFDAEGENWGDVVEVEEDGIYVCKSVDAELWRGLEQLKSYLDNKVVTYRIEEL
jgi:N-dimethylarginine dimethylaminohydrolase